MVDDDTTELSDDALRNRLRRLRGQNVPESGSPVPQMPPSSLQMPPSSLQMPDLRAIGMQPLEITVSKDGLYDSIRYEMSVRVLTEDARDRVLAAIRANGLLHFPGAFPNLKDDEVFVRDYDSGTQIATLRAVITAEEIVDDARPDD